MGKVSTELILAVVAAATGTTTFLGVLLIVCVYCIHRRRQNKQHQQQQEQGDQHHTQLRANSCHNKQSTMNSNETTIDTVASSQNNEKWKNRNQNQNHLVSNVIENRRGEIQATMNQDKVESKNDNADDEENNTESNAIPVPTLVIRSISTSSSRSGTIAQGHHTSSPNQKDLLPTSSDHNKRTISIGGFSLPISFGMTSISNDDKVDKYGKEANRGTHRIDIPNRDEKNNKKVLVEQQFPGNNSAINKKTSKGTILQPTPKSKLEKKKMDTQPKIRRFSPSSSGASIDPPSSSSSSSSSISYINSPSINEFSFRQTQNSIGQYNDDDSHDIHTFDDNWSYAMTDDGSQLLVTGGYSHMVNKRTGGAMFSPSPSIASSRMNSAYTGSSSLYTPSDTANRIETIKEAMESFTTLSTLETSPTSSSWATPHSTNTSSHQRSGTTTGSNDSSDNNSNNDKNNNISMRPVVDSNGKVLFEV